MNWIGKIFMGLLGLGLLAGLLLALGVYSVFATVRWLLTGRKPQVVLVWQQFSALRKGARWGGQRGFELDAQTSAQGDIVDVEVREVVDEAPRLPPRQPG
jgi:hypothetical protein